MLCMFYLYFGLINQWMYIDIVHFCNIWHSFYRQWRCWKAIENCLFVHKYIYFLNTFSVYFTSTWYKSFFIIICLLYIINCTLRTDVFVIVVGLNWTTSWCINYSWFVYLKLSCPLRKYYDKSGKYFNFICEGVAFNKYF